MIATRHEDPRRIVRENTYALRRILIRRLQRATHGIPRRLRAETHLQFVREWKNLVHRGELVTLQVELARSRPGDGRRVVAAGRWTPESTRQLRQAFADEALRRAAPGDAKADSASLLFRLASGLGAAGAPGLVQTGPTGPERLDTGLRQDSLPTRGSGAERARTADPAPVPGCSEPRQADLFQFAAAT